MRLRLRAVAYRRSLTRCTPRLKALKALILWRGIPLIPLLATPRRVTLHSLSNALIRHKKPRRPRMLARKLWIAILALPCALSLAAEPQENGQKKFDPLRLHNGDPLPKT